MNFKPSRLIDVISLLLFAASQTWTRIFFDHICLVAKREFLRWAIKKDLKQSWPSKSYLDQSQPKLQCRPVSTIIFFSSKSQWSCHTFLCPFSSPEMKWKLCFVLLLIGWLRLEANLISFIFFQWPFFLSDLLPLVFKTKFLTVLNCELFFLSSSPHHENYATIFMPVKWLFIKQKSLLADKCKD